MNLNEAVKYLADRGIKRDRSTISKWLKGIGVRAKFGLIQKEALDKLVKMHAKHISTKATSSEDSPNHFFACLDYVLIAAPRYGIRITATNV